MSLYTNLARWLFSRQTRNVTVQLDTTSDIDKHVLNCSRSHHNNDRDLACTPLNYCSQTMHDTHAAMYTVYMLCSFLLVDVVSLSVKTTNKY